MPLQILAWIAARLAEPSTFAGAGIIASAIHGEWPGALGDAITTTLVSASGILAVLMSEKGSP